MVSGTEGEAQAIIDALAGSGIDFDDVVDVLETEGVEKFDDSWARAGRNGARPR